MSTATPNPPTWTIMPLINCWDMTRIAMDQVLAQTVPTRILLVDQASRDETRNAIRDLRMEDRYRDRVLSWHFDPRLPLASVWNLGMAFVREVGGTEAWILNNDVEVHPELLRKLLLALREREAWFVSGVGSDTAPETLPADTSGDFGGPDFSCFVYTVEGWTHYPFDEGFVPAYCEDVDLHRRLMLGGEGQKIFGVNLPFLHHASATIHQDKDGPTHFAPLYAQSERHFIEKWGGPPNQETWRIPFGDRGVPPAGPCTTPELQQQERDIFAARDRARREG